MMKTYREIPKQYIGLITDHSGSMSHLRKAAMTDYNSNIASIKSETEKHALDTIIYTVLCGSRLPIGHSHGNPYYNPKFGVVKAVINSTVSLLDPITEYDAVGHTPLYDSIGELLNLMSAVPDADSPNVSFLVIVITDGRENSSYKWNSKMLGTKIKELQNSDRWTFTFRVPNGQASLLMKNLNVPAGNIYEWDGHSQHGMVTSHIATKAAVQNFYTARSKGKTSSTSFYTDLSNVSSTQVSRTLADITDQIRAFTITSRFHDSAIQEFIESRRKGPFVAGIGFYELMKREKVQAYKKLIIQDLKTKKFYGGDEARTMLGFPLTGTINVNPGDHGNFKIFVQSTSTNRKLKKHTQLLVWREAVR